MKSKKCCVFTLGLSSLIFAGTLLAANLQQFNVANTLHNQDATGGAVGQTGTSVTVSFWTNGASSACYTTTIAYNGSTTVTTGTGNPCAAAVTTIKFAPVASTQVGTLYTAPSNFTPTVGQFLTQIDIVQTPELASPLTSYGPVFDATNGLVVTPGTVTISAQ